MTEQQIIDVSQRFSEFIPVLLLFVIFCMVSICSNIFMYRYVDKKERLIEKRIKEFERILKNYGK